VSPTRRQLREAWGQFLSQFQWDWFVSLTFREVIPTFRAYRMAGRLLRDLERDAGAPVYWFRADEYGERFGRFHMHLLVGNVASLHRLYWMDEWNRRAGYARILPFEKTKGAVFYVAKYITKQQGEWAMSDSLGECPTQAVLPLHDGKTRGYHILPAPEEPRKRPQETRDLQKPIFVPKAQARPGSDVMDVYRSEVRRFAKCRFREFLWPK
jgi:hypothetical protein